MKSNSEPAKSVDGYIAAFPDDVRLVLESIRETIRASAPEAVEKISYGIPTFFQNGNLVHYAAYKTHIGFYPGMDNIAKFKSELVSYETSKGTVRFPINKPIPFDLLKRMTQSRVDENRNRTKSARKE